MLVSELQERSHELVGTWILDSEYFFNSTSSFHLVKEKWLQELVTVLLFYLGQAEGAEVK